MNTTSITVDIGSYRKNNCDRRWELPPWGHPLSQGVLPLFVTHDDHLYPIGTAFTIGRGVRFALSAMHNVRETWRHEHRLSHLLTADGLPAAVQLKEAGLSLLYPRLKEDGSPERLTIWPFETMEGAPPSDLIIGYPKFQTGLPTLVNRLSFDLPPIGATVWSIGYTDMSPERISVDDVMTGKFSFAHDYKHKFVVVEGTIRRVFTQRFASGFVEGACFAFDSEIEHGQSGGPVMTTEGTIFGVNSASATRFFDAPMSIASLLYPILFHNLRFGAQMGPVRLNTTRPLFDLVGEGQIATDGSETEVAISRDEMIGAFSVSPRIPTECSQFVHDDFRSYQEGRKATVQTKPLYRLRRTNGPWPSS